MLLTISDDHQNEDILFCIYQLINQSPSVDNNSDMCDQAAMLTHTQTTQLFKVTKLTQNTILPIIFTLKTIHPARSAKNCDVYVGGKVRVAKFMMSWNLQLK